MGRPSRGASTSRPAALCLLAPHAARARSEPFHRWWGFKAGGAAGAFVALALAVAASQASAQLRQVQGQTSDRPKKPRSIEAALAAPVSLVWEKVPLTQGIERLTAANHVLVVLDRRIDPSALLVGQLRSVSLGEALDWIADRGGGRLVRVGHVLYIGPPEAAAKIHTLVELRRQDLARLPAERRAQLRQPYTAAWPDLAEPPEILTEIAGHYGLEIRGIEQLPIDLWRAGRLVELPAVELLTFVLVQFDMDFAFDPMGRTITLRPVAARPVLERVYAVKAQAAHELVRTIPARVPGLEVAVRGDQLVARGSAEQHEQLAAMLGLTAPPPSGAAGNLEPATGSTATRLPSLPQPRLPSVTARTGVPASPKPPADKKVYSLRLKNKPLTAVLAAMEKQTGLKFELDLDALRRANIAAETPVSLEVRQVSLEDLLDKILAPVGLTYERRGDVYHVKPQ